MILAEANVDPRHQRLRECDPEPRAAGEAQPRGVARCEPPPEVVAVHEHPARPCEHRPVELQVPEPEEGEAAQPGAVLGIQQDASRAEEASRVPRA